MTSAPVSPGCNVDCTAQLVSVRTKCMKEAVSIPGAGAALYDAQKDFSCLDGSKLIPFSFVNDDYCDCYDGSDEPGTSACSTGTFFCLNAAYKSTYIPATRVNDHICDCCDGSDEYVADIVCPNTCVERGRAAREEAQKQTQLAKDGFHKRLEMSQRGKDIRKEKEEEKNRLDAERRLAESVKQEKWIVKNDIEAPEKEALERYRHLEDERKRLADEEEKKTTGQEAEEMFKFIDSNEDGRITVEEIKVRSTFDRNKDGIVSDEEAMFFLNMETEISKEEFLQAGWLIVKPYFLIEKGLFMPPEPSAEEHVSRESVTGNPVIEATAQDHLLEDLEDDEAEDGKEEYPLGDQIVDESEEAVGGDDQAELGKPDPVEEKYDETTRAIIESANKARTEYDNAEKLVLDIAQKLEEVNEVLNLDFGDDQRFAPLHDQCFDFEDREYVYTLCPFKEATQRGRNGGGHVNLGKWGSWRGQENDKYFGMLYEKGQSCWNGPTRSVKVILSCGIEHRVISVSEPSRCEYQMEFISPVACEKPETLYEHDEL